MKSNIIEQEQQLTQTFVKASANILKVNQCQELSSYLYQTACKVSSLVNCSQLIIIISQENTEQIIASNLATHNASRYKNIISKTIKYARQKREYKKTFDNYIYIPLKTVTGEIVGGICALGKQLLSYKKEEILTLEMFAELTATKIDNYRLSQQHQTMNSMIQTKIVNHTKELNVIKAKLDRNNHLAKVGEFTASVIHEIRNSLTIVKMGLEYFSKVENLPQNAKERLLLSTSEQKRLERLLQEILFYSKPNNLQLSELNVNSLIEKSLAIIEQMPQAKGRIIEFIPFPQPINILGDTDKLKQIFINLLRNACEAVGNGELIKWRVCYPNMNYVRISINNGGTPISSFSLSKITQPFYSTKPDGTGLGLAIVERIVQAHGGKLLIQSNLTTGTTVYVELPVAR
ncbi:signal transduction histidine kinase [Rivularia sp. PCC 7116]|uniref:sensor histidine kinase n=1 Tax=Rivularia sp. PCC 7116 TaxID=373994 RepID=UPI00029F38CE|nr:HAMP domain-containing sensor histidine kinase [Rivularia sp. PCC 7116]AFY57191.1 signal transduction histidine kinase [Rivularia sp. PCC 7116]